MKRLLTFVLVAVAVTFSSCLKKIEYPVSPVQGGIMMYGFANQTNTVALDPINIAIRLNTLLWEAKTQSEATGQEISYKDVLVRINNMDQKLIDRLFQSAQNVKDENGVYTITYPHTYYTRTDLARRGTFTINTYNKTLYETGSQWDFSVTNSNEEKAYVELGSGVNIYYGGTGMTLTGSESGHITANGNFEGYTNTNTEHSANWRVSANLNMGGKHGYSEIMNPENDIEFGFTSNGRLMNVSNYSHSVMKTEENLVYTPSCGASKIMSGHVYVKFPDLHKANKEMYPAEDVKVVWKKGADCTSTATVIYNGLTEEQK